MGTGESRAGTIGPNDFGGDAQIQTFDSYVSGTVGNGPLVAKACNTSLRMGQRLGAKQALASPITPAVPCPSHWTPRQIWSVAIYTSLGTSMLVIIMTRAHL
jgi:hypothetical protein